MSRLVIDASIVLAWAFEDEFSPLAASVLRELEQAEAVAPSIWPLEVANGLLVAERRGRVSEAETRRFLALVGDLPVRVESSTRAQVWSTTTDLGRRHGLSAYDASYLDLCLRLDLPLATLDQSLAAACTSAGGRLWREDGS